MCGMISWGDICRKGMYYELFQVIFQAAQNQYSGVCIVFLYIYQCLCLVSCAIKCGIVPSRAVRVIWDHFFSVGYQKGTAEA